MLLGGPCLDLYRTQVAEDLAELLSAVFHFGLQDRPRIRLQVVSRRAVRVLREGFAINLTFSSSNLERHNSISSRLRTATVLLSLPAASRDLVS